MICDLCKTEVETGSQWRIDWTNCSLCGFCGESIVRSWKFQSFLKIKDTELTNGKENKE